MGHVSHCTRDTWQGYYNALERTFFMDHVDDASLKYWEVNCAVHRRGLELIRPGARCRDIAAELNDLFASLGLLKYRYENLRPEEAS